MFSKKLNAQLQQQRDESGLSPCDDSCEISGIINASDTQSSNATRGFSSLVATFSQRHDKRKLKQNQDKSSSSVSPFQPKFRLQQHSLEREQLKFKQIKTTAANHLLLKEAVTPKSLPTGKTIMISKQKFQTVLS